MDETQIKGMTRRKVLQMGLVAAASSLVPGNVMSALAEIESPERVLCFYNLYTHENLEAVYWYKGEYLPQSLDDINYILRDIRTGRVGSIDTHLLDLLFAIQQRLGTTEPFQIVSGYRTPQSNALLRKKKKGVAKRSFHIFGKAADIRIPGFSTKEVRQAAKSLKGGGVGYYPQSHFVHVDVGPVRYWWG